MTSYIKFSGLCLLLVVLCAPTLVAKDPEIISVFPLGANPSSVFQMVVHGHSLDGVYGVWFDCESIKGNVLKVEDLSLDSEEKKQTEQSKQDPSYQVLLEVKVSPNVEVGTHLLRLFSRKGVSNSLWIEIHTERVTKELSRDPLQKPSEVQHVHLPIVINGRLEKIGQSDYYAFDALQGQKISFQLFPGSWPGRRIPLLALYEQSGSWFDSDRLNRLAPSTPLPHAIHEDDTAIYIPSLVYNFDKNGTFFAESAAAVGRGGANYSYQLRIVPVDQSYSPKSTRWPHPVHRQANIWQEREFVRTIKPDRLSVLRSRTVNITPRGEKQSLIQDGQSRLTTLPNGEEQVSTPQKNSKTFNPIPLLSIREEPGETMASPIDITLPSLIEGVIQTPGDVDSFKFRVEAGQRLALEIETPQETIPYFNPYLTVLDISGEEIFTNVYKEIGGDGDDWLKNVEPKTIYSFDKTGVYRLQIRDLTSKYGQSSFVYRLLIRPQIPHVGKIHLQEKQLNLEAGRAKKLTIVIDQEEDFLGQIAVNIENLPPGVHLRPAVDIRSETPPPLGSIHPERFRPKQETVYLMLLASPDTPASSSPHLIDIKFQPIVDGIPGESIFSQQIPIMVIRSPGEVQ